MNKSDRNACKRLSEQIKFFGAKPKRVVSIYAKKPRIRMKIKDDTESIIIADTLSFNLRRRQREAIQQALAAQEVGTSALVSQQARAAQLAAQQYNLASMRQCQQLPSLRVGNAMASGAMGSMGGNYGSGLASGIIGNILW